MSGADQYANDHRGKAGKANRVPIVRGMTEENPPPVPFKGWPEMIRVLEMAVSSTDASP